LNEETNDMSVKDEYKHSFKKANSTFIPQAGHDPTLEFYIDTITKEILSENKKYKCNSNLSHKEHQALKSPREDESIVIKKLTKVLL